MAPNFGWQSHGRYYVTGATRWNSRLPNGLELDHAYSAYHGMSPTKWLTYCVLHLRAYLAAFPTNPPECSHKDWFRNCREGCSGMLYDIITQMICSSWSLTFWIARVTLHNCKVAPLSSKTLAHAIFRRLLDCLPVGILTSDLHHWILPNKICQIRAYDFGVQFYFKTSSAG